MRATPELSFETFLAAVKAGKQFKWPNEDDSDYVRLSANDIAELRDNVSDVEYVKTYGGHDLSPTKSMWELVDNSGRHIMFMSQPLSSLLGGDPNKAKADELIAAAEDKVRTIEGELGRAQVKLAELIAKHRPRKGTLAAKKTTAKAIGAKKAPSKNQVG